jgi:hypothetical protein
MKSFKEYLIESKTTYTFKVKIVDECPKDCATKVKQALAEFDCCGVSSSKTTPISATLKDFPAHKNCSMTVFDVSTNYPATSLQVRDRIAEAIGKPQANVKVLNEKEQEELELNHAHDELSGEALLGQDYEKTDHQDLVGEKGAMSFLASLTKDNAKLEQYTGINDELLAKSVPTAPKGEGAKQAKPAKKFVSPVGSKKVKLTPVSAKTHNSLNVPAKGK